MAEPATVKAAAAGAREHQQPSIGRAELADRLNWLRAAVLGANDGIVSTSGMIYGVAGAAASSQTILIAGIAAVAAGSLSMAAAEYVSVSSQRDYQRAQMAERQAFIDGDDDCGIDELTELVEARGLDKALARQVAVSLTKTDPLNAHTRLGLGFEPDQLTNPWHAALASMGSFILGGLVPLAAIMVARPNIEIPATAAAAIFGLVVTGSLSARLGNAPRLRAVLRTVAGGILAMAVTYAIGATFGRLSA